jgi:hypothetical protein
VRPQQSCRRRSPPRYAVDFGWAVIPVHWLDASGAVLERRVSRGGQHAAVDGDLAHHAYALQLPLRAAWLTAIEASSWPCAFRLRLAERRCEATTPLWRGTSGVRRRPLPSSSGSAASMNT